MKGKALILSLALLPPMAATAEPLERARVEAVLATARAYADDRTLINYCLRYANEMRPFLYSVMQADIEQALVKLRAADADHVQKAELVQAVIANVRFFPPDAKDAALDRRCVSEEVERNYAQLGPVSFGLVHRPPFRQMPPRALQ